MTAPPREPTPEMIDAARAYCPESKWPGSLLIKGMFMVMYDAAPAPSADQDQNGGQGHEASVHCSLGALPLESRNAREATCLNTGPSARIGADTQQGQLGANAGSIPAPPTSTPAAQPAEPVLPCAIDGCKQPSLMPASEYCSLHSAIGTSPTGGEFAPQPAEPTATDDLVARLHDVLRNWTNVTDDEQAVIRDSAAKLQRQAREIAELKSERNAAQRAGVTTANYWMERAEMAEDQRERTRDVWATRAERAEAELHKANIDSANLLAECSDLMAECSDMSVDVEKYRQEIAALRLAVKDDAQWAQENERLTRELDRVKVQLTSEITAALADRDALREQCQSANDACRAAISETEKVIGENHALRECVKAADEVRARFRVIGILPDDEAAISQFDAVREKVR